MTMELWVIHGPLLDQLGTREPQIYGTVPLTVINQRMLETAARHGALLRATSAPDEAKMLALFAAAESIADAIILNPAAYTHTSVALRDAIAASRLPVIEIHVSNLAAREPFRAHSLMAPVVAGSISGMGVLGYDVAVEAAVRIVAARRTEP